MNGPFSDVRIYFATVNIEEGFANLRPGFTAKVLFRTNVKNNVPRLPVQAVRPIDGKHYVAVHQANPSANPQNAWQWKRVELGLSDPDYVEIVSGVKQGERVLADPRTLPLPDTMPKAPASPSTVATVTVQP